MNSKHMTARIEVVTPAGRGTAARLPRFAKSYLMSAAATITLPSAPAAAACVQSGNAVTCSGASNNAFGTSPENNLTLTVQKDASITIGNNASAVNLGSGVTEINNGSMTVGDNSFALRSLGNSVLANNGTITVGITSPAMFVLGNNGTITNAGTINSTAQGGVGIIAQGTGHTVTNSGTMNLTGTASYGIFATGDGSAILNSG